MSKRKKKARRRVDTTGWAKGTYGSSTDLTVPLDPTIRLMDSARVGDYLVAIRLVATPSETVPPGWTLMTVVSYEEATKEVGKKDRRK